MNWLDLRIWGKSLISTIHCLIGCSIGSLTTIYFMAGTHWFLILVISFISGFISCLLFMVLWDIIFRKMKLNEAIKASLKMSFVSMCIMMLTENLVMVFSHSGNVRHEIHQHDSQNLLMMALAMAAGFLIVYPYNYYNFYKANKVCHL